MIWEWECALCVSLPLGTSRGISGHAASAIAITRDEPHFGTCVQRMVAGSSGRGLIRRGIGGGGRGIGGGCGIGGEGGAGWNSGNAWPHSSSVSSEDRVPAVASEDRVAFAGSATSILPWASSP